MVFVTEEFDAVVERKNLTTKTAKADFLGVPRPTFSKVANGKTPPPSEFIAAVWIKFPKIAHRFFKAELR